VGHILHFSECRARNVDAQFFMLEWAGFCFHKKCTRTCYTKLLFLHPMGSVGHLVHSGALGARNVDALMLGWAQCSFHKKHASARYAQLVFSHPVGSVGHVVHSGVSKARNIDAPFFMFRWASCGCHKKIFASRGIYGSRGAFMCVRGAKHDRTIFHARVGLVRIR
jgi:hypothetical protein